jgi:hypothetical protein
MIASNLDGMRWWIEEKGLVMDRLEPQLNPSGFDMIVGKLLLEHTQNGRLQKGQLEAVAKALDEKKYRLLPVLQPSHREKVARYNQEHPTVALKTFEKAVNNPISRHGVQLRFYVARDRYIEAQHRP